MCVFTSVCQERGECAYHGVAAGSIAPSQDYSNLGHGGASQGGHHLCPALDSRSIISSLGEKLGVRGSVLKEDKGNSPQCAHPDEVSSFDGSCS